MSGSEHTPPAAERTHAHQKHAERSERHTRRSMWLRRVNAVSVRAIGSSFARPLTSKKTIELCLAMSVGFQKQMHLRQWWSNYFHCVPVRAEGSSQRTTAQRASPVCHRAQPALPLGLRVVRCAQSRYQAGVCICNQRLSASLNGTAVAVARRVSRTAAAHSSFRRSLVSTGERRSALQEQERADGSSAADRTSKQAVQRLPGPRSLSLAVNLVHAHSKRHGCADDLAAARRPRAVRRRPDAVVEVRVVGRRGDPVFHQRFLRVKHSK